MSSVFRRLASGVCVAALIPALVLVASVVPAAGQPIRHLSTAGGGPGSMVYVAAAGLAEFIRTRAGIEGLTLTAQTTGALLENVRLVGRGETELGFLASSQMYDAVRGQGPFRYDGPYTTIRAVYPAWVASTQWVTYRDDIRTIEDLKGKRVNLGPPGSSSLTNGEIVLRAAGMWDDVIKEFQSWEEGVRLMQDGLIDAFTVAGPPPFPSVMEAATNPSRTLKFIRLTDGLIEKILAEHPHLDEVIVAPDAYGQGIPGFVYESVGYVAYLAAHEDAPADAVYNILKAVMTEEGKRFMINSHAGLASGYDIFPGFSTLVNIGVKLHPGAIRYYEEQGYEIPDELR